MTTNVELTCGRAERSSKWRGEEGTASQRSGHEWVGLRRAPERHLGGTGEARLGAQVW